MDTTRLNQLLKFLEDSPNDSFLIFAVAKEYEGLGDQQKALDFYLRLTDTDPGYVGTYYHLGKLYESLGDAEKALETYEKGMNVARQAGDHHALSELAAAKMELE